MNRIGKCAVILYVLIHSFTPTPSLGEGRDLIGLGYGREFRENTDIAQYEIYWSKALEYKIELAGDKYLTTALEPAVAFIHENGSSNAAVRVSLMPQLQFTPYAPVTFIGGIGVGLMAGDTEYSSQDLGGEFLLVSKIGFRYHFGEKWRLDYLFFHQSNGGLYNHNASLNMVALSIGYRF